MRFKRARLIAHKLAEYTRTTPPSTWLLVEDDVVFFDHFGLPKGTPVYTAFGNALIDAGMPHETWSGYGRPWRCLVGPDWRDIPSNIYRRAKKNS